MFSLEQFIADCRLALAEDQSHKSVREVVAGAVADPAGVLKGLGEPRRAEVQKLLPFEGSDRSQCDLGTEDDDHASQP